METKKAINHMRRWLRLHIATRDGNTITRSASEKYTKFFVGVAEDLGGLITGKSMDNGVYTVSVKLPDTAILKIDLIREAPKGAGRPPLPDSEFRQRVQIRLLPETRKVAKEIAISQGLPDHSWALVLDQAVAAMAEREGVEAEVEAEVEQEQWR